MSRLPKVSEIEHVQPRLFTADEAARYLNVSPRWIRAAWQSRKLPAVKIGRSVRFDLLDLERLIEAGRVDAERGPLAATE